MKHARRQSFARVSSCRAAESECPKVPYFPSSPAFRYIHVGRHTAVRRGFGLPVSVVMYEDGMLVTPPDEGARLLIPLRSLGRGKESLGMSLRTAVLPPKARCMSSACDGAGAGNVLMDQHQGSSLLYAWQPVLCSHGGSCSLVDIIAWQYL